MRVGERIAERRKAVGWSQTRLAREAGVSQGTIGKLEAGLSSGSSHLHRIARKLLTTPAYLTGETDDPDEGAPPPAAAPEIVHVMLPVALPSQTALADMFEGMLLAIDREQSLDAVARELAELLPTSLSMLQGRLIELPRPPRTPGPKAFPATGAPAAAEAPSRADREYQR